MSIDLSGVLTSVGSLLGSNASAAQPLATQIIQQVAIGAAASGFLAALSHPDVKAAMLPFDPLNLAGKSLTPASAAAAAAPTATVTHYMTLAQATAAGFVVNGVASLPAGVAIAG